MNFAQWREACAAYSRRVPALLPGARPVPPATVPLSKDNPLDFRPARFNVGGFPTGGGRVLRKPLGLKSV